MEIEAMTRDDARTEIKRLADLAGDKDRKWSTDDESRWDKVNAQYKSLNKQELPNLGRRDAIPKDAPEWMRNLQGDAPSYEHYKDMRTGRSVPVVRRDQSLAAATRGFNDGDEERFNGIGLGGVLRAMAIGCETETERRALAEGTDSAGGYSVPTILSGQMIDLMRKKSRVVQAGAVSISVDSDKHDFAKLLNDPSPGWRAEAAPVAESDPTFGRVQFAPKSLAVQVKVSEELLQDSVNIESALQNSLANALALEVDRAALFGSGSSNEPLGLFNMGSLNTVSMATNGAAIADYTPVLDAVEDLQESNAGDVTAAIMAPRTLRAFSGLSDSTGQPLRRPQSIDSLSMLQTTQVPIDQTQGTATNASTILLGDYGNLVLGFRQRLRIEVLKELYRGNLQIGFLAHLRMDVQAWHEEAFAKIIGITP